MSSPWGRLLGPLVGVAVLALSNLWGSAALAAGAEPSEGLAPSGHLPDLVGGAFGTWGWNRDCSALLFTTTVSNVGRSDAGEFATGIKVSVAGEDYVPIIELRFQGLRAGHTQQVRYSIPGDGGYILSIRHTVDLHDRVREAVETNNGSEDSMEYFCSFR